VIFALGADADEAVARNDAVARARGGARDRLDRGVPLAARTALVARASRSANCARSPRSPTSPTAWRPRSRPRASTRRRSRRSARRSPEPAPPPLDAAALRASPLRDLVAPLLLDLGDRDAAVTYLRGDSEVRAARGRARGPRPRARVRPEDVHERDLPRVPHHDDPAGRRRQRARAAGARALLPALRPALAAFVPSLLVGGAIVAAFAAVGRR
jgi:hypothetical protein